MEVRCLTSQRHIPVIFGQSYSPINTATTTMTLIMTMVMMMTSLIDDVAGHGRLMDPPARNSMWRLGFNNPINYNDNELYCGGRMVQWIRNGGKCGVCGDAYHGQREHEAGGKYANGIITRSFRQGDVMPVTVHLTANHQGWFEIRVCPVNDMKKAVTQECLEKHLLHRVDGGGTQYPVPKGKYNAFFNYTVQLPSDLTCKQCVVQWKYRTGNTWDKDDNSGVFCLGCGPQEEFYNCADIEILPDKKAKSKVIPLKNVGLKSTTISQAPVFKGQASEPENRKEMSEEKKADFIPQSAHSRKKETPADRVAENLTAEKEQSLQRKWQGVKDKTQSSNLVKPRDDRYSWHAAASPLSRWTIISRRAPAATYSATTTAIRKLSTSSLATATSPALTTRTYPRNPFTPPKTTRRSHSKSQIAPIPRIGSNKIRVSRPSKTTLKPGRSTPKPGKATVKLGTATPQHTGVTVKPKGSGGKKRFSSRSKITAAPKESSSNDKRRVTRTTTSLRLKVKTTSIPKSAGRHSSTPRPGDTAASSRKHHGSAMPHWPIRVTQKGHQHRHYADGKKTTMAIPTTQQTTERMRSVPSIEARRALFRRKLWRHLWRSRQQPQKDVTSSSVSGFRNTVRFASSTTTTEVTPICITSAESSYGDSAHHRFHNHIYPPLSQKSAHSKLTVNSDQISNRDYNTDTANKGSTRDKFAVDRDQTFRQGSGRGNIKRGNAQTSNEDFVRDTFAVDNSWISSGESERSPFVMGNSQLSSKDSTRGKLSLENTRTSSEDSTRGKFLLDNTRTSNKDSTRGRFLLDNTRTSNEDSTRGKLSLDNTRTSNEDSTRGKLSLDNTRTSNEDSTRGRFLLDNTRTSNEDSTRGKLSLDNTRTSNEDSTRGNFIVSKAWTSSQNPVHGQAFMVKTETSHRDSARGKFTVDSGQRSGGDPTPHRFESDTVEMTRSKKPKSKRDQHSPNRFLYKQLVPRSEYYRGDVSRDAYSDSTQARNDVSRDAYSDSTEARNDVSRDAYSDDSVPHRSVSHDAFSDSSLRHNDISRDAYSDGSIRHNDISRDAYSDGSIPLRDVSHDAYSDGSLPHRQRSMTPLYQPLRPLPMSNPVALAGSGGGGWWGDYNGLLWNSVPRRRTPVVVPSVQCRAMVQLGGGMDDWCTANCNANYCPAAMCVCERGQDSLPPSYNLVQTHNPSKWLEPYRRLSHTSYRNLFPVRLQLPNRSQAGLSRGRSIFPSPVDNMFQEDNPVRNPFLATYAPFGRQQRIRNREFSTGDLEEEQQYEDTDMLSVWDKEATQRNHSPEAMVRNWKEKTAERRQHAPSNGLKGWEDKEKRTKRRTYNTHDVMAGWTVKKQVCRATGQYTGLSHYDDWCHNNCAQAMCPLLMCTCDTF